MTKLREFLIANLLGWAIMVISIGVFLALVTFGVNLVNKQKPDHLDFTYHQNVLKDPAIFHIKEPVQVEALFYNKGGSKLTFQALVFWQQIAPETTHQVLQLAFSRTIPPGCNEMSFNNTPPEQVIRFTEELFRQGYKEVKWQIQGSNAVTDPYQGGLQPFQTEIFTYVPNTTPIENPKQVDKLTC